MSLTTNQLDFVTFCIEMYAAEKGMSGQNVFRQFDRGGVLEYLSNNYEALHTRESIILFRLLIYHKAATAVAMLVESEHIQPLLMHCVSPIFRKRINS
ncbi:MAG: DUF3791 domain-containing protein [Planctomycetaceae bacterium]|nr:DUF3791 domain-containing protein [Planctomycetaceae bacterium]